jgi:hypothetical protein
MRSFGREARPLSPPCHPNFQGTLLEQSCNIADAARAGCRAPGATKRWAQAEERVKGLIFALTAAPIFLSAPVFAQPMPLVNAEMTAVNAGCVADGCCWPGVCNSRGLPQKLLPAPSFDLPDPIHLSLWFCDTSFITG